MVDEAVGVVGGGGRWSGCRGSRRTTLAGTAVLWAAAVSVDGSGECDSWWRTWVIQLSCPLAKQAVAVSVDGRGECWSRWSTWHGLRYEQTLPTIGSG